MVGIATGRKIGQMVPFEKNDSYQGIALAMPPRAPENFTALAAVFVPHGHSG